jgi:hypothetical protein
MSIARTHPRDLLTLPPVRRFTSLPVTLKTVLEQLSPQEKEQWWAHAGRSLGKTGLREHDDRLDHVRQSFARVAAVLKQDR